MQRLRRVLREYGFNVIIVGAIVGVVLTVLLTVLAASEYSRDCTALCAKKRCESLPRVIKTRKYCVCRGPMNEVYYVDRTRK